MFSYVCPTYGKYDYARIAVASFLAHTPDAVVVVVDDGHPNFYKFWDDHRVVVAHAFKEQRGLTRSWNFGLQASRKIGAKYTICGNDDVVFTPGWWRGPTALLENDIIGLVGPLTNAPGLNSTEQNIWDHVENYTASDKPEAMAKAAEMLTNRYKVGDCMPTRIVNGFLMVSRTARWWEGRYDVEHVFNPNPRFALIQNEDEIQARFRARGWRSAVSLTSFVFHYRSVTRGDKHKHGMWFRRSD